jgi:SAM-dependent methyltransferase
MSLLDIPFDSGDISNDQMRDMVNALEDPSFAAAIYAKGKRILGNRADAWVPRLTLLAALKLDRVAEFMPFYQEFLGWMDTQQKKDWHAMISDRVPDNDMFSQSGELGIEGPNFPAEFQRLFENIGRPEEGHVLDIGCGGGLWAINLAQNGFAVVGTDRHPGIIEKARWNAKNLGVEDKCLFFVDDACDSKLQTEFYTSRVLCMAVTPCLADDTQFNALLKFLNRASSVPNPSGRKRMVVLGSNRWGMNRLAAVNDILEATGDHGFALAAYRLAMIELNWWMQERHLVEIKKLFPEITLIGERTRKIDGTREDFLLQ